MTHTELLEALARNGLTLAVAESYTGGLVHDLVTKSPGASRVLLGGVIAYDDDVKQRLLGVRTRPLREHGAVSESVALEMARGVRERLQADYGLATTGIAGPDGARDLKPLGTGIAAAVNLRDSVLDRRLHPGDRNEVRLAGSEQALDTLCRLLARDGIL